MKTIIIGLGNPILGDDSVGWRVAELIRQQIEAPATPNPDLEIDCLALGGISLMERMVGYDRAILIDAITTGQKPVGSVFHFPIEALPNLTADHMTAVHDASLPTALQLGRTMGAHLPDTIDIVGIETISNYDFSEELSPPVAQAIPQAVNQVLELMKSQNQEETK
jgi:hydrogenase maturation protease